MLVLDDDGNVVNLLTRMCEREGHDVRGFTSPERALHCLAEEPFDLLITDLAMPDVDGLAVTRQAQQLQRSLFTLIITGHAGSFPLEDVLGAGNVDVMFKPFHLAELRARIALAGRRKASLDKLQAQRREIQSVSAEMIQGLENELKELRTRHDPPSST
jgi:DNA-binding response OmpR family regulator